MKFFCSIFFMLAAMSVSAQDYRVVNNELKILKEISFKENTAFLLPSAGESLIVIKKYLDDKSFISQLRIEAHVNIFGNAAKDQRLSEERAKAVYNKLVSLGTDCKRLVVTGFGNSKPVADQGDNEKMANTNIRFVNVSIRGRLIGGLPADGGGKKITTACK
ncbi:MAG: OmpA family protein [Ferruginibacter sp.]